MSKMVPAAQRAVVSPAKALISAVRPLLNTTLQNILYMVHRVFPHAEEGLKRRSLQDAACTVSEDELVFSEEEVEEDCSTRQTQQTQHSTCTLKGLLNLDSVLSQPTSYRPRLLLEGKSGSGQSSHLAPAVLHALEKFTVYTLDLAVLFGTSVTAPEETCAQIFVEAKRTSPSILYIPHIGQWWETVGPALRATFLSLLSSIPAFSPILLLATCNLRYNQLSVEIQELFRAEYGEVFHVPVPTSKERRDFFEDLILNQAAKAPASKKKAVLQALEVLPVAPPPPPRQLTEEETRKLEEQEEDTLRELRLFLRDVTNRLSQDKRFKAFTKPVDLEEVPDYAKVIKKPMDLSKVLTQIDLHHYGTVKEYLRDVDLIWQNALEYNPDKDPSDRQIRHRACALKDTVHAIIREELDENFEKICEEIKTSRSTRGSGCNTGQFTPSFYHILPQQPSEVRTTNMTPQRDTADTTPAVTPSSSPPAVKPPKSTDENEDDEDSNGEGEKAQEGKTGPAENEQSGRKVMDKPGQLKDNKMLTHRADVRSTKTSVEVGRKERSERTKMREHHSEPLEAYSNDLKTSERRSRGEPMEIETMTTDASAAVRGEEDCLTERSVSKMTRGLKNAVQQQQIIDVDKALQIPDQEVPPLVVDTEKLKDLLKRVVAKTEGFVVYKLEKLYALLCQSIYRHRRNHNKTALLQEMEQEIQDFC
uniref:ATPase family AAA domain containing 2 n=1 Tax=Cynoglossus semilaevis TaxID=244447 RepID=A0A3P8VR80_CYNSE